MCLFRCKIFTEYKTQFRHIFQSFYLYRRARELPEPATERNRGRGVLNEMPYIDCSGGTTLEERGSWRWSELSHEDRQGGKNSSSPRTFMGKMSSFVTSKVLKSLKNWSRQPWMPARCRCILGQIPRRSLNITICGHLWMARALERPWTLTG